MELEGSSWPLSGLMSFDFGGPGGGGGLMVVTIVVVVVPDAPAAGGDDVEDDTIAPTLPGIRNSFESSVL